MDFVNSKHLISKAKKMKQKIAKYLEPYNMCKYKNMLESILCCSVMIITGSVDITRFVVASKAATAAYVWVRPQQAIL